jgi:RHS repeat-associated protein
VPRQKLEYQYDYRGRRIWKKLWSSWNGAAYTASSETRFVYDEGWNLLAEIANSGTVIRRYQWGADLSGNREGAGGVGGLLAITSGSTSQLPFCDGNGNIVGTIDAATGQRTAEYEYGPFGEPLRATGPMAAVNPFRFSTKYEDAETGLLYYGYRYYQPQTGRWLNRDYAEENAGPNIYAFVFNGPPGMVDGLGLDAIDVTGKGCTTHRTRGAFRVGLPGVVQKWLGPGLQGAVQFDGEIKKCDACCSSPTSPIHLGANQKQQDIEVKYTLSGAANVQDVPIPSLNWGWGGFFGTGEWQASGSVSAFYKACSKQSGGGGSLSGSVTAGLKFALIQTSFAEASGTGYVKGKLEAKAECVNRKCTIKGGLGIEGGYRLTARIGITDPYFRTSIQYTYADSFEVSLQKEIWSFSY